MATQPAETPVTDAWFLNVVALRAGTILQMDEIAEQAPERRPMTMAMIFFQAAERDPAVREGLMARGLLSKLQQDTLTRTQAAKAKATL